MNISGFRAPIWQTRATFSGCQPDDQSLLPIGMQANRTTSAMKTARRRTVWSYGIATAKASNGTILLAALRLILSVRYKPIRL